MAHHMDKRCLAWAGGLVVKVVGSNHSTGY